jgi:hypothetical protein
MHNHNVPGSRNLPFFSARFLRWYAVRGPLKIYTPSQPKWECPVLFQHESPVSRRRRGQDLCSSRSGFTQAIRDLPGRAVAHRGDATGEKYNTKLVLALSFPKSHPLKMAKPSGRPAFSSTSVPAGQYQAPPLQAHDHGAKTIAYATYGWLHSLRERVYRLCLAVRAATHIEQTKARRDRPTDLAAI